MLDYEKVKSENASNALSISVPAEELWVPEGEAVFPMRQAFEQALEGFTGPKCPDLKGLEVPFSPLSVDSRFGLTPTVCYARQNHKIRANPRMQGALLMRLATRLFARFGLTG